MFDLKPLSPAAIPAALAKAERYRLLNEPGEAESICLDILAVEPENQDALITLLLAFTDQFGDDSPARSTVSINDALARITDEYDRAYYAGIVCERRGKAHLQKGRLRRGAAEWLREAMSYFERAQALREAGNDDAVLRWNACARILMSIPEQPEMAEEPLQSE